MIWAPFRMWASGSYAQTSPSPFRFLAVTLTQFARQRHHDPAPLLDFVAEMLDLNLDGVDADSPESTQYEPYLWENEKQSNLRHTVLFGFFVQLNRMYTDTAQKQPTNSESNIMPCSTVPHFKYLPISAPALSSRSTNKVSIPVTSNEGSSMNSWSAFTNRSSGGFDTAHAAASERQYEEALSEILRNEAQLDTKQSLEIEIQELKGKLQVMKHLGDDDDEAVKQKMKEIHNDQEDKKSKLEGVFLGTDALRSSNMCHRFELLIEL
ncbi:hypothetical protein Bca4012_065576 [Brassica carinata]